MGITILLLILATILFKTRNMISSTTVTNEGLINMRPGTHGELLIPLGTSYFIAYEYMVSCCNKVYIAYRKLRINPAVRQILDIRAVDSANI